MKIAMYSHRRPATKGIDGIQVHAARLSAELERLGVEVYHLHDSAIDKLPSGIQLLHSHRGISLPWPEWRARKTLRRRLKTPVVCTPHGSINDLQNLAKALPGLGIKRFFTRGIAAFVAVNPEQAQSLESLRPPVPVSLIPNGIDRLRPSRRQRNSNEPIVIGYLGRLEEPKRPQDLIDALALLQNRGEYRARIAGSGFLAEKLAHRARETHTQVEILGRIPETGKQEFFDSLDLFINPSEYEAFGLAAAEALSAGVPVIAASNEGTRFILRDGKCGKLYSAGDIKALATAIGEYKHSPEAFRKLAKAGQERSLAFEWPAVARDTLAVYRDVIP